jgi:hypothetical protein
MEYLSYTVSLGHWTNVRRSLCRRYKFDGFGLKVLNISLPLLGAMNYMARNLYVLAIFMSKEMDSRKLDNKEDTNDTNGTDYL